MKNNTMKAIFIFAMLIGSRLGFAQGTETEATQVRKNAIYGGFFRQTFLYAHYERLLFPKTWTHGLVYGGFGAIPPHEETGLGEQFSTTVGYSQAFGKNFLFLIVGVEPSLSFTEQLSFMDLNGRAGLRIGKLDSENRLFVELGYSPKIYHTYDNPQIPFYLSFGGRF